MYFSIILNNIFQYNSKKMFFNKVLNEIIQYNSKLYNLIELKYSWFYYTLLNLAAKKGNTEIVKLLLMNKKIDVNIIYNIQNQIL